MKSPRLRGVISQPGVTSVLRLEGDLSCLPTSPLRLGQAPQAVGPFVDQRPLRRRRDEGTVRSPLSTRQGTVRAPGGHDKDGVTPFRDPIPDTKGLDEDRTKGRFGASGTTGPSAAGAAARFRSPAESGRHGGRTTRRRPSLVETPGSRQWSRETRRRGCTLYSTRTTSPPGATTGVLRRGLCELMHLGAPCPRGPWCVWPEGSGSVPTSPRLPTPPTAPTAREHVRGGASERRPGPLAHGPAAAVGAPGVSPPPPGTAALLSRRAPWGPVRGPSGADPETPGCRDPPLPPRPRMRAPVGPLWLRHLPGPGRANRASVRPSRVTGRWRRRRRT